MYRTQDRRYGVLLLTYEYGEKDMFVLYVQR